MRKRLDETARRDTLVADEPAKLHHFTPQRLEFPLEVVDHLNGRRWRPHSRREPWRRRAFVRVGRGAVLAPGPPEGCLAAPHFPHFDREHDRDECADEKERKHDG